MSEAPRTDPLDVPAGPSAAEDAARIPVTDIAVNPTDTSGLADTLTGGLRPLRRAALGLGSNLGERFDTLQGAVDSLCETPEIVAVAVSSVYETEPVGGPPGQDPFLNAVLVIETPLPPRALLERAMAVEQAFGRVRDEDELWGPRTLDVDVLAVANVSVDEADLTVPHPRIAERAFVLVPWHEADPTFAVTGVGRLADLVGTVSHHGVSRRDDLQLLLPGR